MIFLVSEISFSTNGMDYLSREEAPEEETARIEGSGREEKANQPRGIGREGGRADVGVRETVHYLVLRSCRAGLNRQNTRRTSQFGSRIHQGT